MGYSKETYNKALEILNERKSKAEATAQFHREEFYSKCSDAEDIQKQLSAIAVSTARAVFQGGNAGVKIHELKERSLNLQNKRTSLLLEYGYSVDYLNIHYECAKCNDTGYIDGIMCSCLKELLNKTEYEKLNAMTPLSLSTFNTFSLKYYDEAELPKMKYIFDYMKRYAYNFSKNSESILLTGGTGLGKTHLSLALANEVLKKNFGVIYTTAQNLALTIDRERFSQESESINLRYINCDLLIIDDLGTEFSSNYTVAAIYNIVNMRLLSKKPTIINTNLSVHDLEKHYSERFVSRLIGEYAMLYFCGKDIRQKLKIEKLKKNAN